jgi:quinol monooxygenase YgiN
MRYDIKLKSRLPLMQYFVLAAAVMATTLAGAARAEDREVYLVRYAEFMPNEEVSGANLLEQYGDASRREDGNLRVEVLHEVARPDRFAILEVWKDQAALEGHDKSASSSSFRERLNAIWSAPYDV